MQKRSRIFAGKLAAAAVLICFFEPLLRGVQAAALFDVPLQRQSAAAESAPTPGYLRTRQVQINPVGLQELAAPRRQSATAAGDAPTVTLNLFPDREHTVEVRNTERKDDQSFVVYGKVEGQPQSQVILAVNNGVIAGSVFVPGEETVQIFYGGDGFHVVGEMDPQSIPGCAAEGVPVGQILPGAEIPKPAGAVATTIDVMVLYTGAARAGAGGTTAMEALIDLAVAEANTTYENSEIDVTLNLVHRSEISYSESGSANTDLTRLRGSGDSHLETAHTLRSQYGADVVILLTESMASYAGLAYVMSPVTTGFSEYAFGVVKRQYATGSYVFAHELGHIMGCQHDRSNAGSSGAYDYSYGFHLDVSGDIYRTVMAYAPGTRIPYFSNPDVDYLSTATGVAAGATNSANNALSINNTAATVAAFAGEAALINLEITSTNITEGAATHTFNVIRSGPTNSAASINYTTIGISATAGSDYTAASGTVTFDAGETEKTISLTVLDDSSVESSETLRISLSTPTGAALGTSKILTLTLVDDDIGIAFDTSTASVAENATNLVVTVKRTGETSGTNTVEYLTVDGTGAEGSDYDEATGTLTFNAGETNKTITITITDDSDFEVNETFQVVLTNATGGATLVSPTNLTATILEDDASLTLTTNAVAALESASSVTFTIARSGGTNTSATVDYFTSEGAATNGVDFTTATGTLTFNAGVSSQTVSVSLLNDTAVDGNKTFTLSLTNASGAALAGYTNVTATILDNDSVFEYTTNAVVVAEQAGSVTLNVARTGGVVGAASVRYYTTNDTATAGSDYSTRSGLLNFAAGETSKSVVVPITNDPTFETNETFNVVLHTPTGESALGSFSSVAVTISDNDSSLSFETNSVSVVENAGTITLNVLRSGTLTETNTVRYNVRAGTAKSTDLTLGTGTLTFAPGETNATITVTITDDSLIETDEQFTVQLSNPTGGALIAGNNTATVTITENDVGLSFSAANHEVDEGATNIVLTVVQTGDLSASPSVDFATADGTAEDGSDYTAATGTLNFGAGTNSLTITIPITDDSALEANETFQVSLSNASGATLVTSNAVVRILENDTVLALSTNAVSANENAANAVLTVSRTGGLNYSVTVDYLTTAGTATNGVDFVSTNGTVTLAAGVSSRTFTVPLLNDSAVDGDKTVTISLTNAVGATLGAVTNSTLTIVDNDSVFEFSTNEVTVAELSRSVTLTVNRTGGVAGAAAVRYATANDSALAGSDYTARSGQLSFGAGDTTKTFTINVANDAVSETNETFTVVLSSPTGEGTVGTNGTVTVTITDNDSIVQWATNGVSVAEGAGTVNLNLTREGTLTETNTVKYTIRAGTATSSDYSGATGTLTFAPGETNATLAISITDDSEVESAETFQVTLSNPAGGAALGSTTTVTVTIEENDVGLAFGSALYSVDEGATNITLTVLQTGDLSASPSVDYTSADGTAESATDYTSTNGTLQFGPGTNSLTIVIPIAEDEEVEGNETFTVALGNVSGATLLANSTATVRILENDSVIAFSTNSVTARENAGTATITVLRTGGTNYTTTVDYLSTEGTATNGVDYVSTNGTLTFGPGVSSRTITVSLLNDTDVDGDKSFELSLTNVVDGVLGSETNKTVTLQDTDSIFEFSTNAVSVSEAFTAVSLTVTRSGGTVANASVRYATGDDTATAGQDYTARSGILNFAAGETEKSITVPLRSDTAFETNEVFTVTLTLPTNEGVLGTNSTVEVTIDDNDSQFNFASTAVSVAEGDSTVSLDVIRTGTLTQTNVVYYAVKRGTATVADYVDVTGSLVFLPTVTNQTIVVGIRDDALVESAETFTVVLSRPSIGALLGVDGEAVVTITENDVGLAFSAATYSGAENETNVVVTVTQTGNLNGSATVEYSTSDLTATNAVDYTETTGSLSFGPGTNSLTITVPLIDDSDLENNETFRVSLSNPSGATLLANSTAVVRILEDDSALAFSTNEVGVLESASSVTLTVLKTGGTNFASEVEFVLADGSATEGDDYTMVTNTTLEFAPGVNRRTIVIPLSNDATVEGDETFSLTLTNITGSIFGAHTNSTVTILDNDSVFNLNTNAVTVSESARTTSLTVTRTGGLAASATVRYATTNDTATSGSDYKAKSGLLKFAANQSSKTIVIGILNDTIVDADETFTIGLHTPTGEGVLGTNTVTTLTIEDNDFEIGGVVSEIGLAGVAISGMDWDSSNCVLLQIEGPLGAAVAVESSTDLHTWTPVTHGVLGVTPLICRDPDSPAKPVNFYRIVEQAESVDEVDSESAE